MLVEDRLRQGLEANATSFTSSGEWRLAQVHRRRRRRTTGVVASAVATSAAIAAGVVVQLGGTAAPAQDAPPAGTVERPASSSDAAPAGGWLREVTAKRGLELGVPRRTVQRLVGADGRMQLGLKLQQQTFTLWTNDDKGRATAWDAGSDRFKSGHRFVLSSILDTCPRCTTTLTWRQVGNDVVFSSVQRTRSALLARWFYEGRWDFAE